MRSSSATAPSRDRALRVGVGTFGLLALAASLFFGGLAGVGALALGAMGTTVYLAGTWAVVRLVSGTVAVERPTPRQGVVTAFLLLMKLPLIYLGWVLAQRLGPFGPLWFLVGLALVYFALVWRAVLAVRA